MTQSLKSDYHYDLDFDTCKPVEVIARSIAWHPSLYRDALREAAKAHTNYALTRATHSDVAKIARNQAAVCAEIANYVDALLIDCDALACAQEIIDMGFSHMVEAFSYACTLNLVPRHLRGEIIDRWKS